MKASTRRGLSLGLLVTLMTFTPRAVWPAQVGAASVTYTVTSTQDTNDAAPGNGLCADVNGQCTPRAAIQEANAQPTGSSIVILVPAGAYVLSLGPLALTANTVSIRGAAGAGKTIVQGTGSTVFSIGSNATVTLEQVTISGGHAANGGGIINSGILTLNHSIVSGNSVVGQFAYGGGIFNTGMLTVANSTISGNHNNYGSGAGLANAGAAAVISSTVSNNLAPNGIGGGGINNTGRLTVVGSTISGNEGTGGGINSGGVSSSIAVTVEQSIISNNQADVGGGLEIHQAATVIDSTISGNTAGFGGGIANSGALSVVASHITGNTANDAQGTGGGINNDYGSLTIGDSSLAANTADDAGGGVYSNGTLTVVNSTLSGNTALSSGGGLQVTRDCFPQPTCAPGMVTLRNSTISGNVAGSGGGLLLEANNTLGLDYTTIAANSTGMVIDAGATATVSGTLVATSSAGPNCSGIESEGLGHNLSSDASCTFIRTSDITSTVPQLGTLRNNGGPTQTMALLPGSPAINHGGAPVSGCPATDQRHVPRPQGPACDIGAFELQQ